VPSNADRLAKLVADNFDLAEGPDFDASFSDLDISSVDAISFFKLVNGEFDLGLEADDCKQFQNLRDLLSFVDSRAG